MAQWGTHSESGILRKNKPKENFEELLVFGYACKLFRDDEKASYIDKGKHLIPWMGDDKLKIDRYDCRGALSDVSAYEASREGFDAMRWLGLNESERKLEHLCDKERYYSLHINEEEEQMYKEEEEKRQKANQFQYSYDVPTDPAQDATPTVPEQEEEDEEFVPAPSLDVPVDVAIPKTVKENTRIEKTALFVCKQGLQMEILIKAKQADNPQFGFLNQGHNLYKYYRHVLAAIKNGRYQLSSNNKSDEKQEGAVSSSNSNEEHYLHPSLVSAASTQPDVQTSTIPPIPYKPSANCSYSQLVNRIQGNSQLEQVDPVKVDGQQQMTLEQQQYYQYYYAAQYYEYYKQMAQYQQGNGQSGQNVQPPDTQLDPNVQNYIQQMAYAQYLQNQSSNTNPYAQIVSNLSNLTNANVQSETNTLVKTNEPTTTTTTTTTEETKTVTKINMKPDPDVADLKKPLLSLAQYGSDSESDDDDDDDPEEYVKKPSGEAQIVIDKMASYVAKNGEQFEEIVKGKGDPRFDFLTENHEFYKYYRSKIKEFKSEGEKKEIKMEKPAEEIQIPTTKVKEKKVITPVSFSIKKPKEEAPKEIKNALPVEESDDEECDKAETCDTTTTSETLNTNNNNNNNNSDDTDKEVESAVVVAETAETVSEPVQKTNGAIFDGEDPILEMIDLTDDLEERKDAKRAEDKIKDKLAAAAREKLASVARDRALQLERKKKAAAFLKLKSAETAVVEEPKPEPVVPPVPVTVLEETTDRSSRKRSRSRSRTSRDGKVDLPSSGGEEGEIKKHKSSKKKKSHKKKHSRSRSSKKKPKKKRRRSGSASSANSKSS